MLSPTRLLFLQPFHSVAELSWVFESEKRTWWLNSPRAVSWGQQVPRNGIHAPVYKKAERKEALRVPRVTLRQLSQDPRTRILFSLGGANEQRQTTNNHELRSKDKSRFPPPFFFPPSDWWATVILTTVHLFSQSWTHWIARLLIRGIISKLIPNTRYSK